LGRELGVVGRKDCGRRKWREREKERERRERAFQKVSMVEMLGEQKVRKNVSRASVGF
jgi:hypothetical protein